MYEAIGGGRFHQPQMQGLIETAIQEAREDDVIFLALGSNDARDMARHGRPETLQTIREMCQDMAKAASQKKLQLLIAAPIGSPCYQPSWCQEPHCEHEEKYKAARQQIISAIEEASRSSVANTHCIEISARAKSKGKRWNASRIMFKENNIHYNETGADRLTKQAFQQLRSYLF